MAEQESRSCFVSLITISNGCRSIDYLIDMGVVIIVLFVLLIIILNGGKVLLV